MSSSFFAAAAAAVWGGTSAETSTTDTTSAHINPKHATKEEVERRIDALAAALASTDTAALLRKGGEPGLLPSAPGTIDRATLSRWLKAEKLDVASAAARLEKHAHWRADYVSCCFALEGEAGGGSRERERNVGGGNFWRQKKRRRPGTRQKLIPPMLTSSGPFSHSIPNPGAYGTHRAGEWAHGNGEWTILEDRKGRVGHLCFSKNSTLFLLGVFFFLRFYFWLTFFAVLIERLMLL